MENPVYAPATNNTTKYYTSAPGVNDILSINYTRTYCCLLSACLQLNFVIINYTYLGWVTNSEDRAQ